MDRMGTAPSTRGSDNGASCWPEVTPCWRPGSMGHHSHPQNKIFLGARLGAGGLWTASSLPLYVTLLGAGVTLPPCPAGGPQG